jgi:alkylation response protein AidB-like acyl-CoA dehydrogenase
MSTTQQQDSPESLRVVTRQFLDTWRTEHGDFTRPDNWMRGFDPDFSRGLSELNLIGLTWPVEYGGRGLGNVARLAVTEELLRVGAPTGAHWIGDRQIGPSIIRHGNPTLREQFLPAIIAGKFTFCLGMSEPEAGSDLASVKTRAARISGGWIVNGRKVWTSGAHHATHMYLLARTADGARKHHGLSEFLVDMNSTGISVSPIKDIAGEHHFNEVLLEDVFVPQARLLGTEGEGWRQVTDQLAFERGGPERFMSSYPVLVELLTAGPEVTDGVRHELGELTARFSTLRQLARRVAAALDDGTAPALEAATLKLLGNTFEHDVLGVAQHAYAIADRMPGPRYFDALMASPGFGIRGGAAEVLLSMIARQEVKA